VEFNTTSPTLSFKAASADDKTKYVELITGAVYPRIAGAVSIVGTVNVPVDGQTDPNKVTASADLQIVDAALAGVTVVSGETPPTNTVNVDKAIKLTATPDYGTVTRLAVTSAVVWISADPTSARRPYRHQGLLSWQARRDGCSHGRSLATPRPSRRPPVQFSSVGGLSLAIRLATGSGSLTRASSAFARAAAAFSS
jgi:hypothetical protein